MTEHPPKQVWLTHTPGQHRMQRTGQSDPLAVRYVLGSDYDELLADADRAAEHERLLSAIHHELAALLDSDDAELSADATRVALWAKVSIEQALGQQQAQEQGGKHGDQDN